MTSHTTHPSSKDHTTTAATTMTVRLFVMLLAMASTVAVDGFQSPAAPFVSKKSTAATFTRHYYANTEDPPPMSEAGNSFEEQMREIVRQQEQMKRLYQQKQQQQQPQPPSPSSLVPPSPLKKQPRRNPFRSMRRPVALKEVSTLKEYKTQVADEQDRISVVRFYSPSCRSCKAATPAFDMLATKHVYLNWVEVPVTHENTALHQGLGVPSVPYGHIYVPGVGLVEELRMVRPQMKRFAQVLQSYVDGQCDLPPLDETTGIYQAPY